MDKRWFRLLKKVYQSNRGILRRPYKLTYVVTKECHSRCLNCDIWKVKPSNELNLEEVGMLAKHSPFLSWIDFTGGEPTDRRDFVEIVDTFLKEVDDLLLVHFPTNGLKPKRIRSVCEQLLKLRSHELVVTVSIDGPPEVNDRLRGIPRDFQRAMETFQAIRDLGISVYVGMTLFDENVELVDATMEAIRHRVPNFRYKDLHINLPHISGHYYGNETAAPQANERMIQVIKDVMTKRGLPLSPFEVVERIYHRRSEAYVKSGHCPTRCQSLVTSCFLSERGELYPCSIWDEPIGNIRDTQYSLVPLLEGERSDTLRARIKRKDCANCWTPCEAYPSLLANMFSGA